jgi:very-short-patch-repair endonuclease
LPKVENISKQDSSSDYLQNEHLKHGYNTANPYNYKLIKTYRDELKKNPTAAENALWKELQNKKIGHKFRRQHIISSSIVDFVCLKQKLVVEVDGEIHLQQIDEDLARTQHLNTKGYRVIRFTNKEVLENPEAIAQEIKTFIEVNNV